MAKGYWIGRLDVTDAERYKPYMTCSQDIFAKFGGRFVVRGGNFQCMEGASRARNVVVEFPDYQSALACYHSSEYRECMMVRQAYAIADIILIEGYDEQ